MSSAVKLSLRSFDDAVRRAYARLFPGDPDKSPEMLDWRFQRNPHGPAKFAVALADDIVVGMIALVPTRLRSAASEVLGFQAVRTTLRSKLVSRSPSPAPVMPPRRGSPSRSTRPPIRPRSAASAAARTA